MTDREERQHVIKVLQNMLDWMEAANMISSKPERIEAVKYAIASIETDLKYDLLYEETSEQADKPITKNCESCRYYGSHHKVCNYCYKCSLWTEQEPKPMVEIDLDYVIKQKYIERDVLDKIRAEIENDWQLKKYPSSPFSCGLRRAIEIIDKYKAESEETK